MENNGSEVKHSHQEIGIHRTESPMTNPSGTAEAKWATLLSKLSPFPSSRENRTRERWLRSTDPHPSVLACVGS
ncbi:hypothetical protein PIB30_067363 [Stylosanthes scabra]|uniref:Uncharacterized protein n=1 Tax=Stylosanthes scabra TaxID=79078 RepID=A0ABU6TPS4_9FABA|nr:hypothetical protein [Stylosanthes scabra]